MNAQVRIVFAVAALFLVLLGTKTVVSFRRYAKVKRDFESVRVGETRASVLQKFGRPNYYEGACENVLMTPGQSCALQYVYSHPFAPAIPEYYVVEFAKNDRVLHTAPLMSP